MRYYFGILIAVIIIVVPWFVSNFPNEALYFVNRVEDASDQLASVILSHNPKSVSDIQSKYVSETSSPYFNIFNNTPEKKVRILLVPGHEANYGGAEYGTLKERELNVDLANQIAYFLGQNNRYRVFISRDKNDWNQIFLDYFRNSWSLINEWQKAHKDEIIELTRLGLFKPVAPSVIHNNVPDDVAMRLYGIGKWVNENDIDIVIHVHLNDYARYPRYASGEYSGFAIYVPQKEYFNSTTTKAVADALFDRMKKLNAVSDLPGESAGIIEDQDLIAVGAYNSVNAASMLVEYGYLYEPQFTNKDLRDLAIKDLAYQTYLGLQDFFDANSVAGSQGSSFLPYSWRSQLTEKSTNKVDIFALQTALALDGLYPPSKKTMNDCPRTGSMGNCTKAAVQAFQSKYGITNEKGIVGPKTLEALNLRFSATQQ